jgi:small subunit ribosomal protein S10
VAAYFASTPFEPNYGAPSVPETLVVSLRLKAYHKFYLNRFVVLLASRFAELGLEPPSQVFLPKKVSRFTVLRSPHVDKRARDQFEQVTHKRLITIRVPRDSQAVEFTYRLLSGITTLAPGVEIRAKYSSSMGEKTRN